MSIPPKLPAPFFRRSENKADQKVTRTISFASNINALAGSLCALTALQCWPDSPTPWISWTQTAGTSALAYCAYVYVWRAYEFALEDYTQRCSFIDANDESKTIQGADSKIADLAELDAAGMIGNANERILGGLEGIPINTSPGTTYVKYSAMQGAGKTTTFVTTNILHMANTKAHFTVELDHEYTEIETEDGDAWEDAIDAEELAAFDAAQSAPIDPYAVEGELFYDDHRHG